MNGNSILLCRVRGIPIKASPTLLIMLPILALLYFGENILFGLYILLGVFASIAAHELGHSFAAMRYGCHVQEIELGILGGAAKLSHIPDRPREEIIMALAGPAVSLALGLLGVWSASPLLYPIGAINLLLFGFNLLPCFPMDGGRVLRAALVPKKGKLEATRRAVQIGKFFCLFFVVFGLAQGHIFLALIGGFIYFAGKRELMMVVMEHQANRYSGFREGHVDVEVSPPPYASGNNGGESIVDQLKRMFRK